MGERHGALEDVVMFGGAYAGRTVLLTGHTGFKGSWLALWLRRLGAQVVGCSLPPPTTPSLFDAAAVASDLEHVEMDIRNTDGVRGLIERHRPHIVFHLAASPLVRASYETPLETFDINVMGTLSVLEAVRRAGHACAIVAISTDKCYENREWEHAYRESDPLGGHDPYSASKAAMEIAMSAFRRSFFEAPSAPARVRLASARAGNVIGGGDWSKDRILPDAVRAFAAGETLRVRNPQAVRPWQHVLEPLSGYLLLGARLLEDEGDDGLTSAWNFGPAPESHVSVRELTTIAADAWGGAMWEAMPDARGPHEAGLLRLACDRAHGRLGWRPVWDVTTAVERTIAWYKCHHRHADDRQAMRAACERDIEGYTADACAKGIAWTS